MQVQTHYSPRLQYHSYLTKSSSMSSLDTQAHYNSSSSISSTESLEEESWRNAAKWIIRLRKKLNVQKSTIYLAISYLHRLVAKGAKINDSNYEKVGAALMLLSAKMNEIYPPKMSALISKCSRPVSKEDITSAEAWILAFFDFDMSFPEITYSTLAQTLGKESEDKLEDCEKLLGLAVTEKTIMRFGEEIVALGVVYLIKPLLVREIAADNIHKIKIVASKVYNLYILNKANRSWNFSLLYLYFYLCHILEASFWKDIFPNIWI